MSGLFGVVSETNCSETLFYGTDYHCHLVTMRCGMATLNGGGFTRFIHDITNSQLDFHASKMFLSKPGFLLEKLNWKMMIFRWMFQ